MSMDEISSKTSITDPGMRARYARKFRNAQKAEFYGDDYLSVVDDKSESGPQCVFNEYVRANELRAWDVQMHQYTGIAYVMGSVNSTFSSCGTTTELIRDFLPTFTGPFEQKMKMYAEFLIKSMGALLDPDSRGACGLALCRDYPRRVWGLLQ